MVLVWLVVFSLFMFCFHFFWCLDFRYNNYLEKEKKPSLLGYRLWLVRVCQRGYFFGWEGGFDIIEQWLRGLTPCLGRGLDPLWN